MARSLPRVIGVNLRRARERAEMTQEELGQLAGVEPATLSRYENGRLAPRFATLSRLAGALKVRPEVLVQESAPGVAPALRKDQKALLRDYEALDPAFRNAARRLLRDLRKARG